MSQEASEDSDKPPSRDFLKRSEKPILSIAFLYNIRHHYPDPNDPRTLLETDFDDPKTIKTMVKHLKNLTDRVIPIEANKNAYLKLYKKRNEIDLVFNYSLGSCGKDGYAQIPAMLEMLQIPYTGSRPLTQALVLNKNRTKEILLANNIPTLPFQIFFNNKEDLKADFNFPLIVKPAARGSSAGITNKSVVKNKKELKRQIRYILKTFNEPALVEPFLTGREFSIAMLGNPPKILPIIESNHAVFPKGYLPLDSLEVKWYFEEKTGGKNFVCPAQISQTLENKIKKICLHVWRALEITDLCRIDIRCDINQNPYVLEVNSPPGMIPPEVSQTSYFPLAARKAGIGYSKLLEIIIYEAWKRYEK